VRRTSTPERALFTALLLATVATVVGFALLVPAHRGFRAAGLNDGAGGAPLRSVPARVESVFDGFCTFTATGVATPLTTGDGGQACVLATARIEGGAARGTVTQLELTPGAGTPPISAGERIRVVATGTGQGPAYVFYDFDRHRSLLLLGFLVAALIVVVGRFRGLAAVLGLVAGGAMVVLFLIPGLLAGEPVLPLTLVGSAGLLIVLLFLVHGVSTRTSCALAGTLIGLGIAGGAAYAGVHFASLYGQDDGALINIQSYAPQVNVRSLIIAGFVLGALGALNDLTVTQASTVWELRAADPTCSGRALYRAAMRVGRDHLASAAYTLVFAYAGTALPTLLLFSISDQPVLDVITNDTVAISLIAALVGVVGLVAVVPMTTALATYVSGARPAEPEFRPPAEPISRPSAV
jgi:uncharacterized membrane protein